VYKNESFHYFRDAAAQSSAAITVLGHGKAEFLLSQKIAACSTFRIE